jgi:hypothetical protein
MIKLKKKKLQKNVKFVIMKVDLYSSIYFYIYISV